MESLNLYERLSPCNEVVIKKEEKSFEGEEESNLINGDESEFAGDGMNVEEREREEANVQWSDV